MELTPELDRRAQRAGAIVLIVLAAGLVTTIVGSSIPWRPMRTWSVFGTFEQGVRGLRVTSPVRVGGVVMGEVTAIQVDPRARTSDDDQILAPRVGSAAPLVDAGDPTIGQLLVTFELAGEIELRADARIVHDVNPFSGIGELDILNVGSMRSPALPGRMGSSAKLAPDQPAGRAFALSHRHGALVTILGRERADDFEQAQKTIASIRAMFIPATSEIEPGADESSRPFESWGPNPPGSATALVESLGRLKEKIEADVPPWMEQWRSMNDRLEVLRAHFRSDDAGQSRLMSQIGALKGALDDKTGLRAVVRELGPLFSAVGASGAPIAACFDSARDQGHLIVGVVKALWPQIFDDLMTSKTGFTIAASELWIAMGPEFWTTAVRIIQPLSRKERGDYLLIDAANRAALSAESLESAIDGARATVTRDGETISPELRRRLEREILPALKRYRRDLADVLDVLEAATPRR